MNKTVSGWVTQEIYLQAERLNRAKTLKTVYFCCGVFAIAGAAMWALGYRLGGMLLGAGICGLLGVFVQDKLYLPYQLRTAVGQCKALSDELALTWDSLALTGSSANGYGVRPWADFHKWKENQHVFLLYFNDYLYEVVPKAWFPSADMVDDFRQCASQIGPVKT